MMVRTQAGHEGKWVYPVGRRCLLGRDAECDIADIFADNAEVGAVHAHVDFDSGRYYVQAEQSPGGTLLNGNRLTARAQLSSGDHLVIGGVELVFFEDSDPATPAAPASPSGESSVPFAELEKPAAPLSTRAVPDPGAGGALVGYPAEKLRALVNMLKRLGRSLDIDETLHALLAGLFDIFPQAERGFVSFITPGQDVVTPRATHFRTSEPNPRLRISRTLVRHVLSRSEAVLWADEGPDQGMIASRTLIDFAVHSLMCAPLLDGDGKPFGIVQIDTDQPLNEFTPEDLELMVGAVGQAAVAVRFARLHEDGLRRQAVKRDLELARRVQLGLLPEGYPECEGFEFFAYYRAAHDVGGDYYDFIELPNNRVALVVADAAGKGVSAALMMAKLSGELKYFLSCETPGAALARMNESLCAGGTGRFVTLLAAILERRTSTLTLVNAGHPAPLRRRPDGAVEVVAEAARGAALGVLPDQQYQETRITVAPGDLWMMYTDGFTEAQSETDGMFGAARLREGLARAPGPVREAGIELVQEVRAFMGDQPQSDDMCLVGWRRLI